MKNRNILLLLFCILLSFLAPWLLLHNSHFSKYFDFSTPISNNIAATIGGILSPLFSLFGSYLVYSALKEQQKSNKIANASLRITRSQSDSAQILAQILVLEGLKTDTKNTLGTLIYNVTKKLDSLVSYFEEERTTMNSNVLTSIQYQILRYINEFEITLELIKNTEFNVNMYYKKLYFTHDEVHLLLKSLTSAIKNALAELDAQVLMEASNKDHRVIAMVKKQLAGINSSVTVVVLAYESLDLTTMILA